VTIDRRDFLAASLPWVAAAAFGIPSARAAVAKPGAKTGLVFGPSKPFSFGHLVREAKTLAAKAYQEPKAPSPDLVQKIDFDTVQKIKFKAEDGLWQTGPGHMPVRFFPLDRYNALPVAIHETAGSHAREILYRPDYFAFDGSGLGARLLQDLGFSGFRVMDGPGSTTDWLAFQGASYFRTAGAEDQYGLSARGIAVDTALSTKEEFPRFSQFWIAEDAAHPAAVTVFALLDGPSLTGAYRFVSTFGKDGAVMDVHAELFMRADITRLGVAPLTSMFWYGRANPWRRTDWRPAIHDSDGLALWTGKGERIWRPLNDPATLQVNSFEDEDPKGFGLMQRDRRFADYEDDGAFYNRRPSVWVEPRGRWGKGAVQLVEIPTDDEIHDNIVAYWLPQKPVTAGSSMALDYRLYWQDQMPFPPKDVAQVVATRIGAGGIPGQPPARNTRKFVIDFTGGPLDAMQRRFDLKPVVSASRGKPENAAVIQVRDTAIWRTFFDLPIDGPAPIDLRCFVKLGDQALTETWLYQYLPRPEELSAANPNRS
jgi:glucans biosynthesis protein